MDKAFRFMTEEELLENKKERIREIIRFIRTKDKKEELSELDFQYLMKHCNLVDYKFEYVGGNVGK